MSRPKLIKDGKLFREGLRMREVNIVRTELLNKFIWFPTRDCNTDLTIWDLMFAEPNHIIPIPCDSTIHSCSIGFLEEQGRNGILAEADIFLRAGDKTLYRDTSFNTDRKQSSLMIGTAIAYELYPVRMDINFNRRIPF